MYIEALIDRSLLLLYICLKMIYSEVVLDGELFLFEGIISQMKSNMIEFLI